MCKQIVLLLALSGLSCNSGLPGMDQARDNSDPVVRELVVPTFSGIELHGGMEVTLAKGDVQHVSVEAPAALIDLLETRVEKSVWQIRTKKDYSTTRTFRIDITVPEIEQVEIEGSGNITGISEFAPGTLTAGIAGSGNIALQVQCQQVKVTIEGSGNVSLKGTCNELDVHIDGSGDLRAEDLAAAAVRVKVAGSGNAGVTASTTLDARIDGSGDIRYRGTAQVTSTVNGSGKISPLP